MTNEDKYDEPASKYEDEMLENQVAFIKYDQLLLLKAIFI